MSSPMPLGARVIALTALLWNRVGLLVFVLRVAVTPEQAALLPPEQQMLDAALPTWVNGVFGLAVIAEASLSYLGLGAPPPNASWGRLLQEAQASVYTAPFGAIAPGLALVSLVIGLNLFADGLRDVADPTRRRSR